MSLFSPLCYCIFSFDFSGPRTNTHIHTHSTPAATAAAAVAQPLYILGNSRIYRRYMPICATKRRRELIDISRTPRAAKTALCSACVCYIGILYRDE